jgi:DNA-directed RNA polymerase subunit RPC12/RpoP
MNFSSHLYRIMEDELGDVGKFVLEKQCKDLNIDPQSIEGDSLPRLSRILSGIMSRFGDEKARRVMMSINNLRASEQTHENIECPKCGTMLPSTTIMCDNCGATLEEDEDAPKLFSKDSEADRRGVEIVDVSVKAPRRTES